MPCLKTNPFFKSGGLSIPEIEWNNQIRLMSAWVGGEGEGHAEEIHIY
jgi:hypothetical protein